MFKNQINELIIYLLIIVNYSKDIHYNCSGDSFYSNHILADRIGENIYNYIDQLKEVCLLGRNIKPLGSSEYLQKASLKIPIEISFDKLKNILAETLNYIENMQDLSKGDENLIGSIAQNIQNNIGLLNIKYSK